MYAKYSLVGALPYKVRAAKSLLGSVNHCTNSITGRQVLIGLCSLSRSRLTINCDYVSVDGILKELFMSWCWYTGRNDYPVPPSYRTCPDSYMEFKRYHDPAQFAYNHTYDMYVGEYGELRIGLLYHCKYELERALFEIGEL